MDAATFYASRPAGHYTDAIQCHPSLTSVPAGAPPTAPTTNSGPPPTLPSAARSRSSLSMSSTSGMPGVLPPGAPAPPRVTCTTFAVADAASGDVLIGKGAHFPCQIASITKVMTAHVVLKLAREEARRGGVTMPDPAAAPDLPLGGVGGLLDELVLISPEASSLRGTTADLRTGEVYTVRDLLFGMMLPSGNDAAAALAEYLGDSFALPASASPYPPRRTRDHPHTRFVAEMNREAARLGLTQTRFGNAHGLSDSKQQSSAADVCKLAAVASRDPLLQAIVSTRDHTAVVRAIPGKLSRLGKWNDYASAPRSYPCLVTWSNTNVLLSSTVRAVIDTERTCVVRERPPLPPKPFPLLSSLSSPSPSVRRPVRLLGAPLHTDGGSSEGASTLSLCAESEDTVSECATTLSGFRSVRSMFTVSALSQSAPGRGKSDAHDSESNSPSLPPAGRMSAASTGSSPIHPPRYSALSATSLPSLHSSPCASPLSPPSYGSACSSPSDFKLDDAVAAAARRTPSRSTKSRTGSRKAPRAHSPLQRLGAADPTDGLELLSISAVGHHCGPDDAPTPAAPDSPLTDVTALPPPAVRVVKKKKKKSAKSPPSLGSTGATTAEVGAARDATATPPPALIGPDDAKPTLSAAHRSVSVKVSREICYTYDGLKTGITPVAGGCLCSTLRLVSMTHTVEGSLPIDREASALPPDYVNPALAHTQGAPAAGVTAPSSPAAKAPRFADLIITVLGSECKSSRFTDTQAVAAYAVRMLHGHDLST